MLPLNPMILMLLATQLNTLPNIQTINYTNAVLNEPVLSQLGQAKATKTDIAQTLNYDAYNIRDVSDRLGLGLYHEEIETLGAGYAISVDKERLSRIHQIFIQNGGESNGTSARGKEGLFWLISSPQALSPKSVGKQPENSQQVYSIAQSQSGENIGFAYNFRGKTCSVLINLRELKITY